MGENARTFMQAESRTERKKWRLPKLRYRIDQVCLDKLDGKISEEFRVRKSVEWNAGEQQTLLAMRGLECAKPDRFVEAVRIFELTNKAHFLGSSANLVHRELRDDH